METILEKRKKAIRKQENFLKNLEVKAIVEQHEGRKRRTISYHGVITYSDWTKNPKS